MPLACSDFSAIEQDSGMFYGRPPKNWVESLEFTDPFSRITATVTVAFKASHVQIIQPQQ